MSGQRYTTPLVAKLAAQHGVDLASVRGTGTGGRITAADVRRAAGVTETARPRPLAPAAVAALAAPTRSFATTRQSLFTSVYREVRIDAYAGNPLADDLRQTAPAVYAEAVRRFGPPPTLFATGDVPAITSSGADPALLLQLPWVARHAAARVSMPALLDMLEALGGPPSTELLRQAEAVAYDTPAAADGLFDYDLRFRAWLTVNQVDETDVVGDGKTMIDRAASPAEIDAAANAFARDISGLTRTEDYRRAQRGAR